jgi:hypothetical protein
MEYTILLLGQYKYTPFSEFRMRIKKPKAFALVPWRQTELKKVVLSTGSSGVDLTDLFPTNVVPAKLTVPLKHVTYVQYVLNLP